MVYDAILSRHANARRLICVMQMRTAASYASLIGVSVASGPVVLMAFVVGSKIQEYVEINGKYRAEFNHAVAAVSWFTILALRR